METAPKVTDVPVHESMKTPVLPREFTVTSAKVIAAEQFVSETPAATGEVTVVVPLIPTVPATDASWTPLDPPGTDVAETVPALRTAFPVTRRNAEPPVAKAWANAVRPDFPILCDPGMTTIRDYKAVSGVYTTLLAPGGRIVKAYPGYSQAMLSEMGRKIERLAGIEARELKVSDAPKEMLAGCAWVAALVVWLMPETGGRELEEIHAA